MGGNRDPPECLGRSRGGFGTKLHPRCERAGTPIAFALTPGQAHDQRVLAALLDQSAVQRPGWGRPRLRPAAVAGGKGYARCWAAGRVRGIRPVIPAKADERRQPRFPRHLYRARNALERLVSRLKQWRRIATRYGKRAGSYAAFVTLVMLRMWT